MVNPHDEWGKQSVTAGQERFTKSSVAGWTAPLFVGDSAVNVVFVWRLDASPPPRELGDCRLNQVWQNVNAQ